MDGKTYNKIAESIIGASIEVHKTLGPGLLESAYKECLTREFLIRNIPFDREKPVPVEYKGVMLECGYRLDFVVSDSVVVEIKSVEGLLPIHESQLVTYLSLGGWKVGLLINFNTLFLKNGIRRRVLIFRIEFSDLSPRKSLRYSALNDCRGMFNAEVAEISAEKR